MSVPAAPQLPVGLAEVFAETELQLYFSLASSCLPPLPSRSAAMESPLILS